MEVVKLQKTLENKRITITCPEDGFYDIGLKKPRYYKRGEEMIVKSPIIEYYSVEIVEEK